MAVSPCSLPLSKFIAEVLPQAFIWSQVMELNMFDLLGRVLLKCSSGEAEKLQAKHHI